MKLLKKTKQDLFPTLDPKLRELLLEGTSIQLFAIVSWGCAATSWLAKILNSHPDIFCLHAGAPNLRSTNSLQYFSDLEYMGYQYSVVGDVHGIARWDIPELKRIFGSRFNSAVVVREPIARLHSFLAHNYKIREWMTMDLPHIEGIIQQKNISVRSRDEMIFVHGANMLNAITDEIPVGTIYKSEDLTTDPNRLSALINEVTCGKISITQEWLQTCVNHKKINPHVVHTMPLTLTDWQKNVLRIVVDPKAWESYEKDLGYPLPDFLKYRS